MDKPVFEKYEYIQSISNIPERYRSATVKDINTSYEPFCTVNNICNNTTEYFIKNRVNIFIRGYQVGNGKTHLATILMNHFIMGMAQNISNVDDITIPPALFVDYAWYIDNVRQKYKENYVRNYVIENVFDTKLLLLDGVDGGKPSEYAGEQMDILINYRYNKMLPTIITSMMDAKEPAESKVLGVNALSRILDNSIVIEFIGCLWRKSLLSINDLEECMF